MTDNNPRRALVASDSPVAKDPRVLRQIGWLIADGWTVDSLGRGPAPASINGAHFEMRTRPHLLRIIANVGLPNALRNRVIVESTIPLRLRVGVPKHRYEAVVINEVELLPWYTQRGHAQIAHAESALHHLDLHEFVPSQGHGGVFRLIFRRYRLWLARFVASPVFTSRSTVSPGVGKLYARYFAAPSAAVIKSCPDFVALDPRAVNADHITLVHHGSAAAVRGLHLMIDAMTMLQPRFSLHLMLVGSAERVDAFRRLAAPLGNRVRFIDPVEVTKVAERLNEFDLEIIFFPPVTANLRHTLPNKLFEAIQGRLGLVIGQSPDMVDLTGSIGNAAVVDGWTAGDLARTLNALTTDDVKRLKARSHSVASQFSAAAEKERFLIVLNQSDHGGSE